MAMEGPRERRRLCGDPSPIEIPGLRLRCLDGFTAREVAAAELLVQLSESSGETSSTAPAEEEAMRMLQRSISSALSSSSSPLSVSSAALPAYHRPLLLAAAEDDDDDDDSESRRLRPRYRSIAEIYVASAVIDTGGRRLKRKISDCEY